jgi:alkanesulfonate monooxygenase SsuD/methylene tetrahydromethanopterin reductase-like flavin-dependent oxidoreductase (luciferase family)
MRFQLLDIIPYQADPVTGHLVSPAERLASVVETARFVEELGFDSFAVGERHAGPFLSAAPTVVLGAIAAATSTIRLQTGVTVLSILDPVRVAEDYATVDQLSGGRLELTVGKGNEVLQYPIFGLDIADQWELLAEKYGALRAFWGTAPVDWPGGRFTLAQRDITTLPRPYRPGGPRVWHGSASSTVSVELAARWGDPLFSANAIQPLENYGVLVDRYRAAFAEAGHTDREPYVGAGAGAGGIFVAATSQAAKRLYGPVYEGLVASRNVPGNNTPYRDIDHAVAEGPALVGSPQQVIDKIGRFHERLGTDLQSVSLPTTLPLADQFATLERFAADVVPVVRAAHPTTLWTDADVHGSVVPPVRSSVTAASA